MYSNPIDLLKAFLSNDAAAQKEAEKNLNQLAKNEPLVSMDLHTSALDNQDLKIAQLAAVSLKQYHLQGMDDFDRIPKEKLQALEKKIFDLFLEGNRPLQLYKRLMELLVLLYANNNDQYSYLVKNVLAMDKAENDNIKISVMFFIEILCENCFNEEHLKEAAADLIRIFENHISDSNIAVGIAAVKGIISLLANIEDKTFVKKFSEILPVLLKTLVAAVKHDEDSGVAIIQSLGELIEIHPSFIKPIVEDLLLTLAEILKEKKFSDGIRNQAMNCIEMLASHCDVAVRKSEAFKNTLIPTFIEVLCEIKEFSLDEWMKDIEGLIISKGDPYFTVQDTIARLSDSLTSKFLLPQFIPYITQCIQNEQWYIKYAGFTAIGVLAQGCAGSFKSELDQIMQLVMSGFDHQDPRVVYASTTAVAHLSNEFQPDLQKKYNKPVLETIIKMLNNEECLKLQLQGARVIVNFCEDIEKIEEEHKIVTPYASELLPALLKLFKKSMTLNSDIALSDSLIGLSMLASVIDLEFAKYANDFLPELKYLLETIPNTDEKHTNIRIEAMECIGFIITSFRNQEGFLQEVDSIMEYLVNLQKNLAKDDPEQASILDVYAQVSSHTLDKFLKYMPHVYDNLLEAVDIEVKISIHKHDDHEEMQKKKFAISGKVESNLVTFDNFVFDTSAFAIKLGALTTLSAFAVNLGKHFRPYIASALPRVVKCFESKEKNISKKSLKTIKHFLNDCETEAEKGEVIALCLPHMYAAINNHVLKENAVATHYIYKQIAKAIDFLNEPVLSEQTVSDLLNSMSSSLTFLSDEKKKIVIKVKELEDCDDQKKEEIENQYEETNNIMHIIMDICGKLLKLYGPKVEGLIGHGIIPYYYNFFSGTEPAVLDSDLLYSICIIDDLLEFSSQEMFERFVQQATTKLMEYAKKPASLSILQSSVFGLGTASKRMNAQLFSQYRNDLLQIISNVVTSKDAFSEEKAEATENAIGALGKIALFQFQKNDKISEEVLLKFLQLLPLKNDLEEAQIVHKMLLEEILKKNDALFSTSQDIQNATIKAVLDISKAISADSELEILNEEGKGLMAQVLQQMNK